MKQEMRPEDLQDLIDALIQTPATVALLVKDLSETDLRVRNSPEEFSAIENVCHLRDIEIDGYTERISKILRENKPDSSGHRWQPPGCRA